jgi:hypothetical protein
MSTSIGTRTTAIGPLEHRGREQDERELGKLRRLDTDPGHGKPAVGAVDLRADNQDGHQREQRDAHEREDHARVAIPLVVDPHRDEHGHQANSGEHGLLRQEGVCRNGLPRLLEVRGAVDHHDADGDEHQRREEQQSIELELACHVCAKP